MALSIKIPTPLHKKKLIWVRRESFHQQIQTLNPKNQPCLPSKVKIWFFFVVWQILYSFWKIWFIFWKKIVVLLWSYVVIDIICQKIWFFCGYSWPNWFGDWFFSKGCKKSYKKYIDFWFCWIGGKAKPLKAPKTEKKEYDEVIWWNILFLW